MSVNDFTKDRLKGYIDSISTEQELTRIENAVYKQEVEIRVRQIISQKFGKVIHSITDQFIDIVLSHHSSIDDKIYLLDKIVNDNGLWCGNEMLTAKAGNIYNRMSNDIAKQLAKPLATRLQGPQGLGPDQGPGEVLMVITGMGVNLASIGDLNISDKLIEVKATSVNKSKLSGGRLYGTKGYGSNSTIKVQLSNALYSQGISKQVLHKHLALTPKTGRPNGGFNLNPSGLENLNNVLSKLKSYAATCAVLNTIVTGLFVHLDESVNWASKVVQADGSFDSDDVLCFLIEIAHDYYKTQCGHDAIMYFNSDNGNYRIVEDSSEYEDLFNSGILKMTSHIDWNNDRGKGSAQIVKT